MGVYALIIAGASTAIADAASACPTWPACGGRWLALDSPALTIVWAHRAAAAAVGALVVAVTALAWLRREPRRVRAALSGALALYPLQVAVGAVAAGAVAAAVVSGGHLARGVTLVSGRGVALAWTRQTRPAGRPEPDDSRSRPADPEPPADPADGALATARAYLRLTKPRLMWLLCLVAAAGMALAAGSGLDPGTVVATLGGGVLAIGASGIFNNVLERERDRKMARTADRPVAQHRIPVRNALAFGVALAVVSVAVFLTVNVLAAALGLVAILYYSVVYTLVLKPNTVQNTVVGGFAGSLPALIGWAAVTETVGVPALALAGVIFLWTPAHFYNLALAYKDDYEAGGFPMLPVVRGEAVTRKHIVWYLGATLVAAAVLAWVSRLGPVYAGTSAALGAVFLWAVIRLHRERTATAALRSFHASNAYLGLLLVAIVVDALAV
jgi:protoheme IX farnesyltransferase